MCIFNDDLKYDGVISIEYSATEVLEVRAFTEIIEYAKNKGLEIVGKYWVITSGEFINKGLMYSNDRNWNLMRIRFKYKK